MRSASNKDVEFAAPSGVSPALSAASVEFALLGFGPDNPRIASLPATQHRVPVAEALHRALVATLAGGELAGTGHELIGVAADGQPLADHRHTHVLPLDLDCDRQLDHALLWTPCGLGAAALQAVLSLPFLRCSANQPPLSVMVTGLGDARFAAELPPPFGPNLAKLLTPARIWRSLTPFVCPRFLKKSGKNSLQGQVAAELACRGLPTPVACVSAAHPSPSFRHYVLSRSRGGQPPPVPHGFDLQIEFAEPVQGPLCLGYGSHFGLGMFAAVPA